MPSFERTLVILPTYNEKGTLANIIARIRTSVPQAHVLVVDDASPDGTGDLADALAHHDAQVTVMHRTQKNGLGAAYLAAFGWALDAGYEVIVESDADGSHLPEELPRLLDGLEGNDLAIGSRWVAGGRVVDWPLSRRVLSRGGSGYARTMLGLQQHDVTSGYRAFRASALRALSLASVSSQGYCFQIELLWRAQRAGLAIAEVPITFVERVHGASKMRGSIVVEAMARVTVWGLSARIVRQGAALQAANPSRT